MKKRIIILLVLLAAICMGMQASTKKRIRGTIDQGWTFRLSANHAEASEVLRTLGPLQFNNGIACGGHADGNVARLLVASDGETIACKEFCAFESDVDRKRGVGGFGTWIEHHQHYVVACSTGVDEWVRVLSLC